LGDHWESPPLHILLTQEDDVIAARCLDFTVSSHGEDETEALNSWADAIREYILTAVENQSVESIYDPAHGKCWRMYDGAKTKKSYPVKSHGKKTVILSYALEDMIKKFALPLDVFHR